jgi:ribonuclease BN (tRNA processing enzyme)
MKAAGIELSSIRAIFLTHHHLDHIGGLAPLLVNRWVQMRPDVIAVIGPSGTERSASDLAAAFGPTERAPVFVGANVLRSLASSFRARDLSAELEAPALVYEDGLVRVFAVLNDHYHYPAGSEAARLSRSYGYRVEAGGKSIVFTGDTGPSPRLLALAKGADILVSEVMDREAIARDLSASGFSGPTLAGLLRHMDANHLTPRQVGELAGGAGVKAVVLSHLVPGRDGETGVQGYLSGLSTHFTGPVRVANDLDRFDPARFGRDGE